MKSDYRLDIQGLRAFAVIIVVIGHAEIINFSGFLGVDVFFVISGFVISQLLLKEFNANGKIKFANFYLKRFKRLMPIFALAVTLTILIGFFILPIREIPTTLSTAVGGILISSNYFIADKTGNYFAPQAEWNPLLHLWSLSVEEQFYLIFPLILLLALLLKKIHQHVVIYINSDFLLKFILYNY